MNPSTPSYSGGFTINQNWQKIEATIVYKGLKSNNQLANTAADGCVPGYMSFRLGNDQALYTYYLDDFKIEEQRPCDNMVVNGEFNPFNNLPYATLASSSKFYGFRGWAACNTTLVAPGRDGMGYCARITETGSSPLGVDVTLKPLVFRSDKVYELSAWVKLSSISNSTAHFAIPKTSGFDYIGTTNNNDPSAGIPVTDEWTQVKVNYTPSETFTVPNGDNTVCLKIGSGGITYYLDDFCIKEIYNIGEYPEALAVNISGGSFAGDVLTTDYIYDYSVSEGNSYYEFKRVDPLKNTEAILFSGKGNRQVSYTLSETDIGCYFKYEITPVDTDGKSGATVTAVSDVVKNIFEVSASFTGSILVNSTLGSEVQFTNNSGTGKNIIVIIAVYDSENTLISATKATDFVAAGGNTTVYPSLALLDDVSGYTAKIFVWEGTNYADTTLQPFYYGITLQ